MKETETAGEIAKNVAYVMDSEYVALRKDI